jgi:hypothetical protein
MNPLVHKFNTIVVNSDLSDEDKEIMRDLSQRMTPDTLSMVVGSLNNDRSLLQSFADLARDAKNDTNVQSEAYLEEKLQTLSS